jgi:hypothetical protein
MSDKKIETLDDIGAFLEGTVEVEFAIADKGECYRWVQHTLVKFSYLSCSKKGKGLITRYLEQVSGYSSRQVKRLVQQYRSNRSDPPYKLGEINPQ